MRSLRTESDKRLTATLRLAVAVGAPGHVVLDAGLLPRRAYAARLIGQALAASARGHGHRPIASGLAVPAGTVRG